MQYCKECNKLYFKEDCLEYLDPSVDHHFLSKKIYLCPVDKYVTKKYVYKGNIENVKEANEYILSLVIKKPIHHVNLLKLTPEQLLKVKEIFSL